MPLGAAVCQQCGLSFGPCIISVARSSAIASRGSPPNMPLRRCRDLIPVDAEESVVGLAGQQVGVPAQPQPLLQTVRGVVPKVKPVLAERAALSGAVREALPSSPSAFAEGP
jgi:hypothetical protein